MYTHIPNDLRSQMIWDYQPPFISPLSHRPAAGLIEERQELRSGGIKLLGNLQVICRVETSYASYRYVIYIYMIYV